MSFEEIMIEHTKALKENTKALIAYTKALNAEQVAIDIEHSATSACGFCGITFKTLKSYAANGLITPSVRRGGKREWYKESSLVALCEAQKLFSGDYGELKGDPTSPYFGN